jgi:hypothetical protein
VDDRKTTDLIVDHVLDGHPPLSFPFLPMCASDEVVEFHVLSCTILVRSSLNIVHDLLTTSIVVGPVGIVLEEELKAWSRDVAGNARISVFEPYATNICDLSAKYLTICGDNGHTGVLIIELEVDVLSQMFWEPDSGGHS